MASAAEVVDQGVGETRLVTEAVSTRPMNSGRLPRKAAGWRCGLSLFGHLLMRDGPSPRAARLAYAPRDVTGQPTLD